MALTKYALGELIQPYFQICGVPNLSPDAVSGVNRDKEFFEPARQIGQDTSSYKVVPPGYFACNLMHVGRDCVLPIAMNHTEREKIVTSAYIVFCISQNAPVIKEYFYLFLKSNEKDRFFWFHADSSVRDGITWNAFCEMELELPPLPIQRKYVDIYKAMIDNQRSYERGLEDLKLVCDGYIEDLRRKLPCEPIGLYISRHDVRNGTNGTKNVMGISISKQFKTPNAKVNREELSNYKVCCPRQIAFVQTTHNEKVFTYAFNNTNEDIVVSPVDEVFSTNENNLLPEYLCMFFNRSEFDRYARFYSWGSAREIFTWDDLIEVTIPIPDISVQKAISEIYTVYIERKRINEKLKAQIKDICPILIKGSLEEGQANNGR